MQGGPTSPFQPQPVGRGIRLLVKTPVEPVRFLQYWGAGRGEKEKSPWSVFFTDGETEGGPSPQQPGPAQHLALWAARTQAPALWFHG